MNAKLIVVGGKKAGMEIPITTPTFLIGQTKNAIFGLNASSSIMIHCQISVDKNAVSIEDSSGAVGTFVNGEKIKWRHSLKHGDRIKVGTLELEIQYAEEEKPRQNQFPSARKLVARAVVPVVEDDRETDISKWVEDAGQKEPAKPCKMQLCRF